MIRDCPELSRSNTTKHNETKAKDVHDKASLDCAPVDSDGFTTVIKKPNQRARNNNKNPTPKKNSPRIIDIKFPLKDIEEVLALEGDEEDQAAHNAYDSSTTTQVSQGPTLKEPLQFTMVDYVDSHNIALACADRLTDEVDMVENTLVDGFEEQISQIDQDMLAQIDKAPVDNLVVPELPLKDSLTSPSKTPKKKKVKSFDPIHTSTTSLQALKTPL